MVSQKQRMREIMGRVNTIGICSSLRKHHLTFHDELMKLFQNHPEADSKLKNAIDLAIIRNSYNQFSVDIQYQDGTSDTISIKTSISGKAMTLETTISRCLRAEIVPQILEYRAFHTECEKCGSSDSLEVDHCGELEFQDIKALFLQTHSFTKKDFRKNKHTQQPNFINRQYATEWANFHKQHATYQCLCKKCHLEKTLASSK